MSGFFGSVLRSDCVSDVFYGTDYHSHLGTRRAGMAVYHPDLSFQRAIHSLEDGYFRNKFEHNLKEFRGRSGIGVISDTDAQPMLLNSHLGTFALSTVCKIVNTDELTERFLSKHQHFTETIRGAVNPTELVAMLISEGEDFVSGILNVYESLKGSCSMLILTDNGLIAARDKLGRTPVIVGKKETGFALTTETCAFHNLGYVRDRDLGPGEIVRVTAEGVEQLKAPYEKMQICAFLWVYYGYPPCFYEGVNVEEARYRCGAALARRDGVEAEFAAGIPDSGIGHAIGYANERKIPYMRPYIKYTPTWPRSFMPQSQETRDLVAKMKLMPNPALTDGKRGVFLDDSIVRGTQLKDNVRDLFDSGMTEAHMRIACPPLTYPCEFLNFSRSRSSLDLASRKAIMQLEGTEDVDFAQYSDPGNGRYQAMVEQIRKNLGCTSLMYQHIGDLVEAIGLPKESLCTHCWDGSSYF